MVLPIDLGAVRCARSSRGAVNSTTVGGRAAEAASPAVLGIVALISK
jgi:hypothetical protein